MKVKMHLANLDAFDAALKEFRAKLIALEDAGMELCNAARNLDLEISQPADSAAD